MDKQYFIKKEIHGAIIHKTPEEVKKWENEQLEQLQDNLLKILTSGSYQISTSILGKIFSVEDIFLLSVAQPREEYYSEQNNALMEYLLSTQGKKLVSIDCKSESKDAYDIIRIHNYSFDVKDKTFQEKLNPNNPQYTQQPKAPVYSPEQQASRRKFAEALISYYKMAESDEDYKKRVEEEDKTMKGIADTVNKTESVLTVTSGRGLMNKLMAAQNLSLTGEKDFLEYVISQPGVDVALRKIRDDKIFERIKAQAEQNMQQGKIKDGRVIGHQETTAEREKRCIDDKISKNPNYVAEIKSKLSAITTKTNFTNGMDIEPHMLAIVARTMGYVPELKYDGNKCVFEKDTSDKTR